MRPRTFPWTCSQFVTASVMCLTLFSTQGSRLTSSLETKAAELELGLACSGWGTKAYRYPLRVLYSRAVASVGRRQLNRRKAYKFI